MISEIAYTQGREKLMDYLLPLRRESTYYLPLQSLLTEKVIFTHIGSFKEHRLLVIIISNNCHKLVYITYCHGNIHTSILGRPSPGKCEENSSTCSKVGERPAF